MKGIVLSGGLGTRLFPITKVVSKQLLPIYDKPMIYYPLSVLLLSGIRDILIISTPHQLSLYKELFGDGSELGIELSYKAQHDPKGLADAFIVGEEFIGDDDVALILGDNIFYGQGLSAILQKAVERKNGALIFGYYVKHPSIFGVVEIDKNTNEILSLEEKPPFPKSNFAVPGLYFYDNKVTEIVKNMKPSSRGELEITDLNNEYLKRGELKVELFGRGLAWFDTGTPEGLLEASNFVSVIQKRQGFYIACLEEICYGLGYIDDEQLYTLATKQSSSDYGNYLRNLLPKD